MPSNQMDVNFLKQAHEVAQSSRDPSTRVGAVLVSPDLQRVVTGYNRFPECVPDRKEWWNNRDDTGEELSKYDLVCCAEQDAILTAHTSVAGWTLYVTHFPCINCAKSIVFSGIRRVVFVYGVEHIHRPLVASKVKLLFQMAGVIVEQHPSSQSVECR